MMLGVSECLHDEKYIPFDFPGIVRQNQTFVKLLELSKPHFTFSSLILNKYERTFEEEASIILGENELRLSSCSSWNESSSALWSSLSDSSSSLLSNSQR